MNRVEKIFTFFRTTANYSNNGDTSNFDELSAKEDLPTFGRLKIFSPVLRQASNQNVAAKCAN